MLVKNLATRLFAGLVVSLCLSVFTAGITVAGENEIARDAPVPEIEIETNIETHLFSSDEGMNALKRATEEKNDVFFGGVDRSSVGTGILMDKVLVFSDIEAYEGGDGTSAAKPDEWKQMYHEMYRGALDEPLFPELNEVEKLADSLSRKGVIPVAIMNIRYNKIKKEVIERELAFLEAGAIADALNANHDPYHERRVFAVSALKDFTYRNDVVFAVDEALYFSNDENAVVSVEMDLDDGAGFRPVNLGERIVTAYREVGEKSIRLRVHYRDKTLVGRFIFHVREMPGGPRRLPSGASRGAIAGQAAWPGNEIVWANLRSQYPYKGEYAHYDAHIFLGDGNTSVLKPFIFVEGFDIKNDMASDELFALLSQQGFASEMRRQGYDIVILNFRDATDYIQKNGFCLVSLIQKLEREFGAGNMVVAGASMGGLVSRYALAYMESMGLNHYTRLLLTFDTPHRGANIPLGVQYWILFFAIQGDNAQAQSWLNRLNSPAAKQMLVYHHTSPGVGPNALRGNLIQDLSDLGNYPAVRKIAAINGSSASLSQTGSGGVPMNPGVQIIKWRHRSFEVDIDGNAWALPDNLPKTRIFQGRIDTWKPLDEVTLSVSVSGTLPYDNAPGGWRDTNREVADTDVSFGDITTAYPRHCFIPATSALDLDGLQLFHPFGQDRYLLKKIPFETVFYPPGNESHVALTPRNSLFMNHQINWLNIIGILPVTTQLITDPSYLMGDLDGNGCVDRRDLAALLRIIRGLDDGDPIFDYDLNNDRRVNIADARKLVTLFSLPRGNACN